MISRIALIAALTLLATPALAGKTVIRRKPRLEIAACAAIEHNAAADKLKAAAAKLRARAVEIDTASDGNYEVAAKFDAAQSAFDTYIDAACDYEAATYTTGSLAGTMYGSCKTALIEQRLKAINEELAK